VEKSHSYRILQRTVQIAEDGPDQLRFRLLAEALLPFDTERTLDDVQGILLSGCLGRRAELAPLAILESYIVTIGCSNQTV
jgi:hypothetical protein